MMSALVQGWVALILRDLSSTVSATGLVGHPIEYGVLRCDGAAIRLENVASREG
jgi:hypothetical protein